MNDIDQAPPGPPVRLAVAGSEIASYHDGRAVAGELSPRPYLHPVRSPAGQVVTEVHPADHTHHYGVSAAVVDVNGTSYWGGRSYVDGQGYVKLANQGRQVGEPPQVRTEPERTVLTQQLTWFAADGVPQLVEHRDIRLARSADGAAHLITWRSTLRAERDLTIGSPATRGRTGAGYGGLFWRLGPESGAAVRARTTTGLATQEAEALGAVGPWLTLTEARAEGPVTVLLAQPAHDQLPWFVRATGYTGAGPAVAWEEPQPLRAGEHRDLHLWAAVADADLDPAAADLLHHDLGRLAT